ncbi:DUF1737 domain-containing protein [Chitinophaga varians]|nr:DUF1737 domain-containing protein [Chitinophaga varians]
MITDYIVLDATETNQLVVYVKNHIREGWQPLGPMQCFNVYTIKPKPTEAPVVTHFAQTMIKHL